MRLRGGRLAGPSRCRAPAALKGSLKNKLNAIFTFPAETKVLFGFPPVSKASTSVGLFYYKSEAAEANFRNTGETYILVPARSFDFRLPGPCAETKGRNKGQ